jgi:hypothetical protein
MVFLGAADAIVARADKGRVTTAARLLATIDCTRVLVIAGAATAKAHAADTDIDLCTI